MAFASAIPTLPKHCKIPEPGQETLFQFVFVALAVRSSLSFVCEIRLGTVTIKVIFS